MMEWPNEKKFCYTFTWKIRNFRLVKNAETEVLISPAFSVEHKGESEWEIFFCPITDHGLTRITLKRIDGFINAGLDVEMSYLAFSGDNPEDNTFQDLPNTNWCECYNSELTGKDRDLFLQQDTIIIRCKLWHSSIKPTECFGRTVFRTKVFGWNVHEDSISSERMTKMFDVSKASYVIKVFKFDSMPDVVNVVVERAEERQRIFSIGKITVISSKGEEEVKFEKSDFPRNGKDISVLVWVLSICVPYEDVFYRSQLCLKLYLVSGVSEIVDKIDFASTSPVPIPISSTESNRTDSAVHQDVLEWNTSSNYPEGIVIPHLGSCVVPVNMDIAPSPARTSIISVPHQPETMENSHSECPLVPNRMNTALPQTMIQTTLVPYYPTNMAISHAESHPAPSSMNHAILPYYPEEMTISLAESSFAPYSMNNAISHARMQTINDAIVEISATQNSNHMHNEALRRRIQAQDIFRCNVHRLAKRSPAYYRCNTRFYNHPFFEFHDVSRWFSNSLRDKLLSIYRKNNFSDAVLIVEGVSFPVHRIALTDQSPLFTTIFEEVTKDGRLPMIEIRNVNQNAMEQMLLFLYTTKLDDVNLSLAIELYTASILYGICDLQTKCQSILKVKVAVTSASDLSLIIEKYKNTDLKQDAGNPVYKHDEIFLSDLWRIIKERIKSTAKLRKDKKPKGCNSNVDPANVDARQRGRAHIKYGN